MSPLTPADRRAQELASALEGRSGGVTLTGATRATETRAAEIQGLVALAERVRAVEAPPMRADFAANLRARLIAAAERELALTANGAAEATVDRTRGTAAPPGRRAGPQVGWRAGHRTGWRNRLVAVTAAVFVVASSSIGVAAASQSALPGTVLYPVKRAVETLQADTAGSPVTRGQDLLNQATTRLSETVQLTMGRGGQPDQNPLIDQTLGSFQTQASSGAGQLLASYEQTRDKQAIRTLRTFTHSAAATLARLGRTLPATGQHALAAAATTLVTIDESAQRTCAACSPLPVLTIKNLRAMLGLPPTAFSPTALPPGGSTSPAVPALPGRTPASAHAPAGPTIPATPAATAPPVQLPAPAPPTAQVPRAPTIPPRTAPAPPGPTSLPAAPSLPVETIPTASALPNAPLP